MSECCCSGSTTLIYSCSGAADVGEIADRVSRKLSKDGYGKMSCLAAIGAQLSGYVASAKGADRTIVIDGCKTSCGKKNLEALGLQPATFIITEMGFTKGKTPSTDDIVDKIVNLIINDSDSKLKCENTAESSCCC